MEDLLECPVGCEDQDLPAVVFDDCTPEINLSEIVAVFVARIQASDFVDVADPAEWALRLSQTDVPPVGSGTEVIDLIRRLTVIADKPAPTDLIKEISNARKILVNKTHILNVTIDETNATNHDFLRRTECGLKVKMWYLTAGGKLYGGNSGIKGSNGAGVDLKLNLVLNRGNEEIETLTGTAEWKAKQTEAFAVSPI